MKAVEGNWNSGIWTINKGKMIGIGISGIWNRNEGNFYKSRHPVGLDKKASVRNWNTLYMDHISKQQKEIGTTVT